jgi:ABC-type molybdate transport system substrate-binding protein
MKNCTVQPLKLYGAGSLKNALNEIAQSFTIQYRIPIETQFGASGLLRDRIEQGEVVDIFASADMGHPTKLMMLGKSGPVVNFACNRLCAFVRGDLPVNSTNLLEFMLKPDIRLGTSTPQADPSGDYAWEIFRKCDRLSPGSFAILDRKALCLTGGRNTSKPPKGSHIAAHFILETQQADIFLTYFTAALTARQMGIPLRVVQFPPALAVTGTCGMTLLTEAQPATSLLAMYILAPVGQAILAKFGFDVSLAMDGSSTSVSQEKVRSRSSGWPS